MHSPDDSDCKSLFPKAVPTPAPDALANGQQSLPFLGEKHRRNSHRGTVKGKFCSISVDFDATDRCFRDKIRNMILATAWHPFIA